MGDIDNVGASCYITVRIFYALFQKGKYNTFPFKIILAKAYPWIIFQG